MASKLEDLMGGQQAYLPTNLSERKQMVDLAKETPEFSDLIQKKGADSKKDNGKGNSYKAKQSVRGKQIEGKQLESLVKLLVNRGMTREQAMAKIKEMGYDI